MFTSYKYFKGIAQRLNLTSAAEELYVSQPALSKYLTKLEGVLGVTLIDRTAKPLRLTEAGRVYASYVEEYERLLRSLSIDMSRFSEYKHHVAVGITTWRGSMILPTVYEQFLSANPAYDLEFKEAVGDVLLKQLEDRNVDFCLMNLSSSGDGSRFSSITIETEEIRIVMRKHHPLFERFPDYRHEDALMNLNELQQEAFILLLPSQQLTRSVDALMRSQGFCPSHVLRLSSMSTALSIVAKSDFLSFFPHSQQTGNALGEELVTRRIAASSSSIPFSLVTRAGSTISSAVVPVIEFLLKTYHVPLSAMDHLK